MRESYFLDDLMMSAGTSKGEAVADVLLGHIPNAVQVTQADTEDDKQGVDYWVILANDHRLAVDVKVRTEDYYRKRGVDDLALETWSVIDSKVGWTRDPDKRTDYVLWMWQDTGRWCLIPFHLLCAVFQDKWRQWKMAYKTSRQRTHNRNGSWVSECVFVPRVAVWRSIYNRFGGHPSNVAVQRETGGGPGD